MNIGQLHFLVAEADDAQRRVLVEILQGLGAVQITEAADGDTALRCLGLHHQPAVNVIILDLQVPGTDALEVIRRMGELQSRAGLIIFGAQTNSVLFSIESMADAFELNVLGVITRPLVAGRLEAVIARHLQPPDLRPERTPTLSFAEVGHGLNNNEFAPHFQPKIELETGRVKGLEMFARWRHPRYGILGPASFMPALVENHRIDFLDWALIEKSVQACRRLHDDGIPISFSVNVDPSTLAHPQFMEQIGACLERHRIMPDYLTFEMTEKAVLTTTPYFLERLLRLRMKGFGLAIDDYGTGLINLQLLARVPFSELKIDRSFVDGAFRKPAIATVLRSCLGLALSLDRRSVAVGVETKQDWDFLQGLGCTYAQGYYIARPMPVEEFPDWLSDWRHFF